MSWTGGPTVPSVDGVLPSGPALLAALSGLAFGLSLIVAIGAQNAFVIRQGVRGEHVGVVVLLCAVSDAVLIVAGVAGAGVLLGAPTVDTVVRWAGAAFLLGYAALAARRALRPSALTTETGGARVGWRGVALTTLALTWLNPHVYLDTLVLTGSVASGHGPFRWWFALGSVLASALWFTLLGRGARALRPLFARPSAWRVLDASVAVVMTVTAVVLIRGS